VGLFRTEFLFLDRADEPSESEQTEAYAAAFGAFGEGIKIVVRTLDAGADKPLPFLDQGEEGQSSARCPGPADRSSRSPRSSTSSFVPSRRPPAARKPTCG
jgi:hypothetical protein